MFGDYACADERLEITLPETGPTLTVDLGPNGVDLMGTLFAFINEISAEAEASDMECGFACIARDGTTQEYIDVQVTVNSSWPGGLTQKTVKQVRVHLAEAEPQTNPVVKDLSINGLTEAGTASLGSTLTVLLDPPRPPWRPT